jgi:hypothetical protein
MPSILEQYRVSDFLEWESGKRLILNPDFQRGSVWTPAARTYLIDTILRQLPVPKIYLRTIVDKNTKKSVREVVDGQQRLRTIVDFANDKITLSKRAGDLAGYKYSTLSEDLKDIFLSYPIAVDQILNADDTEILEVFARLNSYSVQLNGPEKRHAKFQGDFKWAVRAASKRWHMLWDDFGLFSIRQRVRMMDDSYVGEMFGILMEGVRDGGQPKIDGLYKRHDAGFDKEGGVVAKLDNLIPFIIQFFGSDLLSTGIMQPPHFLMLFAAVAHARFGIPQGDLQDPIDRPVDALMNIDKARDNLLLLANLLTLQEPPEKLKDFWLASKSTTHRIASRAARFPVYLQALRPIDLG